MPAPQASREHSSAHFVRRVVLLGLALALLAPAIAGHAQPAPRRAGAPTPVAAERQPLVDINSASGAELARLPGVNAAIAGRIIAGRPWASKYDLVIKKVVARATYEKFARLIVARQPG